MIECALLCAAASWHVRVSTLCAMTDELPQEVILSIQRVLDLKATPGDDPLDVLDNFNPVDILNNFFPDGEQTPTPLSGRELILFTEASLGQIDAVKTKLAQNELELQREVDSLREELKKDQDPGRMHLIQEMISVSIALSSFSCSCLTRPLGSAWSNVANTRKGHRVGSRRKEYHQRYTSVGSCEEEFDIKHDYFEEITDARCARPFTVTRLFNGYLRGTH